MVDGESSTVVSYSRASAILRQPHPITAKQVGILDKCFAELNATDLLALTSDPAHERQLRRYRTRIWLRRVSIVALFLLAVGFGLAVGLIAAYDQL